MTVRTLIAEDSPLVRRILKRILTPGEGFEVVGAAPNGRVAVSEFRRLRPDAVVLDVEMPEMSGLQALRAIRQLDGDVPVVMFSSRTSEGASATIEALSSGASDYASKPTGADSPEAAMRSARDELLPKLRSLVDHRRSLSPSPPAPAPSAESGAIGRPETSNAIDAILIGVSTGGPMALGEVVPRLPADLPAPVLVVQHMPENFTRLLAERLDRASSLAVAEARGGEHPRAGEVWIAPGGRHLRIEREAGRPTLALDDGPPENSCRPAVDVLLRSAAEVYRGNCLALVLTGMGSDGLRGCELLSALGAHIFAQDADTSTVWGMPGSIVHAGLAQRILPLHDVAVELASAARRCSRSPIQAEPALLVPEVPS